MKKESGSYVEIFSFFLPISFVLIFSNIAIAQEKTYSLPYADSLLLVRIAKPLVEKAYLQAGFDVSFSQSPVKRAIIRADEGAFDGDIIRTRAIEKKYKNMIRVNEPLLYFRGAAYTNRKDILYYNDSILKKYKIGHLVGSHWSDKKIIGIKSFPANDLKALFQMLLEKRIDLVLVSDIQGEKILQGLGDRAHEVRRLSPYVYLAPTYHYVHQKNKDIVPQLEKSLKDIIASGYWETIDLDIQAAVSSREPFVFYTGVLSPTREVLARRLQRAFKLFGKECRIEHTVSSRRALVMANDYGDGDAMRVADLKNIAPEETNNLIRVNETILSTEFCVYTRDKNTVVIDSDLSKLEGLRNGFRGGIKLLEDSVPGKKIVSSDPKQLFTMLSQGRLDTVIEHKVAGDKMIVELGLEGIGCADYNIVKTSTYPYVNKKKAELIPFIEAAIRAMKADGSFYELEEDI